MAKDKDASVETPKEHVVTIKSPGGLTLKGKVSDEMCARIQDVLFGRQSDLFED